jgi:acetylornithine/N-succinyldiaminopimelate aminotransferase
MTAGTHGSTFGGNPLAATVGAAVLDVILAEGFLESVAQNGESLKRRLLALKERYPSIIEDVRGEGLMFGVKTRIPNGDFATAARDEKLLTVLAGDNVVRLLPPLTINQTHIDEAATKLEAACARLASSSTQKGAA